MEICVKEHSLVQVSKTSLEMLGKQTILLEIQTLEVVAAVSCETYPHPSVCQVHCLNRYFSVFINVSGEENFSLPSMHKDTV